MLQQEVRAIKKDAFASILKHAPQARFGAVGCYCSVCNTFALIKFFVSSSVGRILSNFPCTREMVRDVASLSLCALLPNKNIPSPVGRVREGLVNA